MNVTYNDIYDFYIEEYKALESIFILPAMEADGADPVKKENAAKRILDSIKLIIDRIVSAIGTVMLKIKNNFQKFLLTDKGFQKELRTVEVQRKPLNSIKVLTFDYKPEYLNRMYNIAKAQTAEIVSKFNIANLDSLTPMSAEDVRVLYCEKLGAKEATSIQDLFLSIKNGFRGKKTETTILASNLPEYINLVNYYKNAQGTINNDLGSLQRSIGSVRATSNGFVHNPDATDEKKKKAIAYINGIAHAFNLFNSIASLVFALKVEQMLTARTIIKRLYQI